MSEELGLFMKYFVLNPTKDGEYGIAARRAMLTYADSIENANWDLASGIRDWVDSIRKELMEKRYSKTPF